MQPTPEQVAELWRIGNLSYKLHEGQKQIRKTIRSLPPNVREALVFCSRRYGKSYLAACLALEDCLKTPHANVIFIGPSIRQTLDIVRLIFPEILHDAPKGLVTQSKSEKRWHFSNGSQLMIGGFDTARESIRGLKANSVYLEESGSAHPDLYEYTIKSVLMPTMMHSQGRLIHLTTPAPIIDHPLHAITIPKTQAEGSYFRFTIRDNPLLSLEIIEREIHELGGLESSHCQRELFCNIVRDEQTTVVPQFDEKKHVSAAPPPADAYYWISGDIGGVRDKSVLHLCAYDHVTKKTMFLDERAFDPKTPTVEIVKGALEMEAGRQVYRAVDAPGQLYVDLSAVYNYPCFLPEKLHFDQNIHRVQTAFWKDEVLVNPTCKLLIATLNSGQLNKQRTDFARTEALGHCDALASLVYGLRHADRRAPIQYIKPGEDVWNRQPKPSDALVHQLRKLRG
jgi:hypothetical protein